MTIKNYDQIVSRKMKKLRMFDIAQSMASAAKAVIEDKYENPDNVDWLKEATNEWENYVEETRKELGIC